MIEQAPLKVRILDVHPAVCRRLTFGDHRSIADLHRVIQLLMGWEDDNLDGFRIHGREYKIEQIGGMPFDEDAEDVPLSRFAFRPAECFLYQYDFTDGWETEIRVEKIIGEAISDEKLIPRCIAGRERAPPDGSGGPRRHAERHARRV